MLTIEKVLIFNWYLIKMAGEIDLVQYWNVILRNRKRIFIITLSVVLVVLIFSLISPKTYESESVIQLAAIKFYSLNEGVVELEREGIYSTSESLSIIRSSVVLDPVINKFYPAKSLGDFRKSNLEISAGSEKLFSGGFDVVPFLNIKTKAESGQKAKDINQEIIDSFFAYVNPTYEEKISLFRRDLENSEEKIGSLESNINDIEKQIKSLENSQFSSEGLTKVTLLKSLLANYQEELTKQEEKRSYLQLIVSDSRDYRVISYPKVPEGFSEPNISRNLLVAFIFGLFASLVYVLFKQR